MELKNAPAQKAPGEDRAVKNFNIKDADKLEAGMTVINVRGLGMKTRQIIEVLVNDEVKGTFTQQKSVKSTATITLSEALKEGDKVKAILKDSSGIQLAATDEYTDPKGVSKTATATKGDNGEWTVPDGSDISVDKTSGVVTITFDKIKNKTNVDAKVTDEGFNVCR